LILSWKYGRMAYGFLFLASGLYASLLFVTAAMGYQNAANSVVFGCAIVFIFRAGLVVRDTLLRPADAEDRSKPSSVIFMLGDLVVLASLIATAYVFWTSENRMDSPIAPLRLGISIGYFFYLFAVPMRFAGK
jgi:hypothetical protein